MEFLALHEHTDRALHAPFCLPLRTPVPDSITGESLCIAHSRPNSVLSFWNEQLDKLDLVILESASLHEQWNSLIPNGLKPAAGKIQLPALTHLAHPCNIGGSGWIHQFLYGFPPIGRLAHKRCCPVKIKEARKKPTKLRKIIPESRFSER